MTTWRADRPTYLPTVGDDRKEEAMRRGGTIDFVGDPDQPTPFIVDRMAEAIRNRPITVIPSNGSPQRKDDRGFFGSGWRRA